MYSEYLKCLTFQWMVHLLYYKINTSLTLRLGNLLSHFLVTSFCKWVVWVPLKECKKLTLSLSQKKPLVQATSWICLSFCYLDVVSALLALTPSQCVSFLGFVFIKCRFVFLKYKFVFLKYKFVFLKIQVCIPKIHVCIHINTSLYS